MIEAIWAALLLLPAAQEAPPPPPTVEIGSETYRLLEGEALGAAIVGTRVSNRECFGSGGCTAWYGSDGRSFRKSGDRVPIMFGSYAVLPDRYCMTIYANSVCKALYRSAEGEFLEMRFYLNWGWPAAVDVVSDR